SFTSSTNILLAFGNKGYKIYSLDTEKVFESRCVIRFVGSHASKTFQKSHALTLFNLKIILCSHFQ
ncbi:hypothetical protein, partial [Plesiomonas shigelloides]|uniref:hypothetical protein n=1 Tax=Plesiomonas shigelloides TaxID=703 RepID=UPI001E4DB1BD